MSKECLLRHDARAPHSADLPTDRVYCHSNVCGTIELVVRTISTKLERKVGRWRRIACCLVCFKRSRDTPTIVCSLRASILLHDQYPAYYQARHGPAGSAEVVCLPIPLLGCYAWLGRRQAAHGVSLAMAFLRSKSHNTKRSSRRCYWY